MRIPSLILRNMEDAVQFGPLYLWRHIATILHIEKIRIRAGNFGRITIRPGNSDAATLHQVFVDRSYDLSRFPQFERVKTAYEALLNAGKRPIIVDAGANIGAASIWLSRQFPRAFVIAVEPDPDSAKICRENISELENVRLVEAAIGNKKGQACLDRSGKAWATRSTRSDDGETPIISINEILADAPENSALFMVKIDIEGFEDDLFAKNTEWMDKAFVLMIELHDWMLPGKYSSHNFLKSLNGSLREVLVADDTLFLVK